MAFRTIPLLVASAVVAAACAGDGGESVSDDDGTAEGPATATIVTTTTIAGTTTTTMAVAGSGSAAADDPTPTDPAPTTTTGASSTEVSVTTAPSPSTTPAPAPTTPPRVGDPNVSSEIVGDFARPIDLAIRPGDDRLYIVEQSGRVVRYDGDASAVVLDIAPRVSGGNEQGLLGLAFSPDGSLGYIDFTDTSGDTQVVEFAVDPDGVFDPASERTVLSVDQPFGNHNAGDLAFGPDGLLYITLGDGGSGGDPERNGNDPSTLLGSLLRIDPTPDGDRAYTIPPGNPGLDDPGVADEVWAWGLRNPWKIAFDPVTEELWIADVGQNEFEEINVVAPTPPFTAGRAVDFGWSAFEGTERFNADVADIGPTMPVLTYSHADGCSVSGGAPYRGAAIPELEPAFVYSDFCTGTIWALDLAGSRNLTLLGGFGDVSAVRVGPDGELYVLERTGSVHRLVPG